MDFILKENNRKYEKGFYELLSERGYLCKGGIEVELKEGGQWGCRFSIMEKLL